MCFHTQPNNFPPCNARTLAGVIHSKSSGCVSLKCNVPPGLKMIPHRFVYGKVFVNKKLQYAWQRFCGFAKPSVFGSSALPSPSLPTVFTWSGKVAALRHVSYSCSVKMQIIYHELPQQKQLYVFPPQHSN